MPLETESDSVGGSPDPAPIGSSPVLSAPVGVDAPILEVMSSMRAMRRLRPDPVPDELLRRVIEAEIGRASCRERVCSVV